MQSTHNLNRTLLAILIGSFVSIFAWRRLTRPNHTNKEITVGILQTASHPALDAARDGFVKIIRDTLGNNVQLIIQNAQGSVANAHAIAQSFHARADIDGIFAIATPAAKAMASIEKAKPIVFAAVTDPHAIGLMRPNGNMTGSTDMINVAGIIELIRKLTPSVHKVGLLFNISEINSVILTKKMENALANEGLKTHRIGITSEAELPQALDVGLRSTDLILAPTDNTVASSIDFIAQQALRSKKPLIVSDNLLVPHGALASRGVNYFESGKQAAAMLMDILQNHKNPAEIPLGLPDKSNIVINNQTLSELSVSVPQSLKAQITYVDTKATS